SARYLQAYGKERMARTPAQAAAAARAFLDVAYDARDAPIAVDCYIHAGEYFASQTDPASLADATTAFSWLVDSRASKATTLRPLALAKLGKVLWDRHKWTDARATFCKLLAEPAADSPADAERYLAGSFVEADDLPALDAACGAGACPCTEPVLANLVGEYLAADDEARARKVLDLAAARFPLGEQAPALTCASIQLDDAAGDQAVAAGRRAEMADRFSPTSAWSQHNAGKLDGVDKLRLLRCPDVTPPDAASPQDRALVELKRTVVSRCYADAVHANPDVAGTLALELEVGARGVAGGVRRTGGTLVDESMIGCVSKALQRHRWSRLDDHALAIRLAFVVR
ncbi:MAG: hypothetical protein NT062_03780, partial [Proteobacteria bacterium]|nr:hypothetical protein [Pseudomonadota bacterium]